MIPQGQCLISLAGLQSADPELVTNKIRTLQRFMPI
jgi:hypothetical protein